MESNYLDPKPFLSSVKFFCVCVCVLRVVCMIVEAKAHIPSFLKQPTIPLSDKLRIKRLQ